MQSLYDLGFVGELTSSIFSEPAVISNLMIKTILHIYITRKGGEGGEGRGGEAGRGVGSTLTMMVANT